MTTLLLKRVGNSLGVTFPKIMLKQAGINEGQRLDISLNENSEFVLKPVKNQRPKYKLKDLLDDYDPSFESDPVLKEWQEIQPVGNESW